MVEARGKAGVHGAIWQVIPMLDWLLQKFEHAIHCVDAATLFNYPDQEAIEDHYAINLKCGWKKLIKYFNKINKTPAYYTATLLNPATKLFCSNAWVEHPEWIIKCDAAFQKLWSKYKDRPISASSSAPPKPKRQKMDSGLYDHIRNNSRKASVASTSSNQDEFVRWMAEDPLPEGHVFVEDPIGYWLHQESRYPLLSQLALDILTIPASSADCETTFSECANMLEPRQSALRPDFIGAAQCQRNWKRNNFIKQEGVDSK